MVLYYVDFLCDQCSCVEHYHPLSHFPKHTGQINTYCQNIKEFTAQNLGKLFMAQALQEYNN